MKGALWQWGREQTDVPQLLHEERLTRNTTMSYFDPKKEMELIVDASPIGLISAQLIQTHQQQTHCVQRQRPHTQRH